MLAEIVTITIPDWVCCLGWGVLIVACFIGCLYLFVVFPYKGAENKLRKQIAALVAPMPGVFRPSNPRQLLSYEEVVAAYSGGIDNCLCTGAYSVLLNPKIDICSVCNDKGTIKGRQCSCQVAKYWKDKKC